MTEQSKIRAEKITPSLESKERLLSSDPKKTEASWEVDVFLDRNKIMDSRHSKDFTWERQGKIPIK